MNAPAMIPTETLPRLIDKATEALECARSSAEVLEARDIARVAYDAAKSAGRMAKAKSAHDSLMVDVHRSQAHALAIRARAEMRLAEEYDAAQERGEVAGHGRSKLEADKLTSVSDLGLRHDEIHEARRLRDAEQADPGLVSRTLDGLVERGEEPTRAALKREITKQKPKPQMAREPLWVWGRIKDFERDGILRIEPSKLVSMMTDQMRRDMRDQLPQVIEYLDQIRSEL